MHDSLCCELLVIWYITANGQWNWTANKTFNDYASDFKEWYQDVNITYYFDSCSTSDFVVILGKHWEFTTHQNWPSQIFPDIKWVDGFHTVDLAFKEQSLKRIKSF